MDSALSDRTATKGKQGQRGYLPALSKAVTEAAILLLTTPLEYPLGFGSVD